MYVYDYVSIKGKFSGWGVLTGSVYKTQDYQNIINEKAKNG